MKTLALVAALLCVVGCDPQYIEPDPVPDAGSKPDAGSSGGWPVMPGLPAYAWTPMNCPDSIVNKDFGTIEIVTRGTPCLFQHRRIDISHIPDDGQIQIQLFNFPTPAETRLYATVSVYLVINDLPDYHDAPKVALGSWNDDQAFHLEFKKPAGAQKFAPVFEITVAPNSARYTVGGFYIFEYTP